MAKSSASKKSAPIDKADKSAAAKGGKAAPKPPAKGGKK